jgi:pimeloyl-ACP methyl ester carboxylesterase
MRNDTLQLPGNIGTEVRYHLPEDSPWVFILSGGYGGSLRPEPVQLTFIDVLEKCGMGWLQYVYPERWEKNRFTDLYISTGISTLAWLYEWIRDRCRGSIGLFGYSFGANIALEMALAKPVDAVVLVNAVFDYVDYRTQQLGREAMRNWQEELVVTLPYAEASYSLGYRFIQEAEQQDLERRAAAIQCEVHAFQAENDAIIRPTHIRALAGASACWHANVVSGVHADHDFEHPTTLHSFAASIEPVLGSLAPPL